MSPGLTLWRIRVHWDLGRGCMYSIFPAACTYSVRPTTTVKDPTELTTSTTFTGSTAIATDARDGAGEFALNGIEVLEGSLGIDTGASPLSKISADSFSQIRGSLYLYQMPYLRSLQFPQLAEVDSLSLQSLPDLERLSFSSGVQLNTGIDIVQTALASLEGINARSLRYFDTVDGPIEIGNVLAVNLPLLEEAGSTGFWTNDSEKLSLPSLRRFFGNLTVADNPNLTNLSLPSLETVTSNLVIEANGLESIDGLPKLSSVGDMSSFGGKFTG
ncbi:cell wall protein Ecm33 [Vermiconidia calcicola]|uniref:Cell wall protein Ecm33 n=1 Tax=Vermiconidia calcicola TaxID=1690605 RepID=A0ACC3MXK7_9PEZI|nr:cell wall protein Ecm33 [Vermiconidia calcicola]